MNTLAALQSFVPSFEGVIDPLGTGSVNSTYRCVADSGATYVLQQMHPVLSPLIMTDVQHVYEHSLARGFTGLPTYLLAAGTQKPYIQDKDRWWRCMEYVTGSSINVCSNERQAYEAGKITGSFHSAVRSFDKDLVHRIRHFHDTEHIVSRMCAIAKNIDGTLSSSIGEPATTIALHYKEHLAAIDSLPRQIIHGDLKISNIRFDSAGDSAVALLDLDTLMYGSIAIELGDALRSWCNREGEDNQHASFSIALYESALRGYCESGIHLMRDEIQAIPHGVACITLELAARFVADAIEDTYFVHDVELYATRREQNIARAKVQLALYYDIVKKWGTIQAVCSSLR